MGRIKAYNASMRIFPSKPAPVKYWSSVGIMLTDWCSSSCASCYLRCSPQGSNWMAVETAVDLWEQLESLSPHGCRVHLTGGEVFGDWERLLAVARMGKAKKLTLDKVETNAFWVTDEKIVRDRLKALDEAGMKIFSISADPFHQQFIPIDRPRLAARIAEDVLGPERVQVRWKDWLQNGCDLINVSTDERNQYFAGWISNGRDRFNGRAAEMLTEMHPQPLLPSEVFSDCNCREGLFRGKQIHIDPQGNIIPGVCAGLILGRTDIQPLANIWEELYSFAEGLDYPPGESCELLDNTNVLRPILRTLTRSGPYGLMKLAEKKGFLPAARYASKCHLCWFVRRFLYRKQGLTGGELGPERLYSQEQ